MLGLGIRRQFYMSANVQRSALSDDGVLARTDFASFVDWPCASGPRNREKLFGIRDDMRILRRLK